MNTTYKPVDREFLEMLAAAKARGITWMRLAEMTKKPVVELEVILWREPKAWAKACKYAEKLVQHEALSETIAVLRTEMNNNVNNVRLKTQVANSVVRVIQLQHMLRTPKKPKKPVSRPTPEPTPTPTLPLTTSEPVVQPLAKAATSAVSATPLATVAAIVLLLLGVFALWRMLPWNASESPLLLASMASMTTSHDEQPNLDSSVVGDPPNGSDFARNPCKNRGLFTEADRKARHEWPQQRIVLVEADRGKV